MKLIKTLFLILISFKSYAQGEKDVKKVASPILIDVQLDAGAAQQNPKLILIGSSLQINSRFKYHLFANLSYVNTKEVGSFIDIVPTDGTMLSNFKTQKLSNVSLSGGVHFTKKYFYSALSVGVDRAFGDYFDNNTNRGSDFNKVGGIVKVQFSGIVKHRIGTNISYAYEINNLKNFQYLMAGLNYCF